MVWWLAPLPHSERAPGSIPFCVEWVLSRYYGFLPLPKSMHVSLIDGSKFYACERGWLFVLFGPVKRQANCPGCILPLAQ